MSRWSRPRIYTSRSDGAIIGSGAAFAAVVPAQAGTHNHSRSKGYDHRAPLRGHGVWVPACAGTTAEYAARAPYVFPYFFSIEAMKPFLRSSSVRLLSI